MKLTNRTLKRLGAGQYDMKCISELGIINKPPWLFFTVLTNYGHFSIANALLIKLFTKKQAIQYALHAAEFELSLWKACNPIQADIWEYWKDSGCEPTGEKIALALRASFSKGGNNTAYKAAMAVYSTELSETVYWAKGAANSACDINRDRETDLIGYGLTLLFGKYEQKEALIVLHPETLKRAIKSIQR